MKKKFAIVLAMLLVLSMGTTVYATGSPDSGAQAVEKLKDNITSIDSSSGTVSLTAVDETVRDDAVTAATNAGPSGDVLALADVSIPAGTDVSKGVTLTFYVSGISAGDNVYALHQLADGSWEVCNTIVGNGYVKVTLYSLSPVAIVKYGSDEKITPTQTIPTTPGAEPDGTPTPDTKPSVTPNGGTGAGAGTTAPAANTTPRTQSTPSKIATSPKTGNGVAVVLPVIAVLALAGIVVLRKKA